MSVSPPYPPGIIRSFDPNRDQEVVASLIEQAFELQNDPEGQKVLRQMRQAARIQAASPLSGALNGPQGSFVWEVSAKVVGNINLIPFSSGKRHIALVANVAVSPAFRRQGIATHLTEHALRVARQWGRNEIWLQVRSENQAAIHLYERLSFRFISALSQWRHEPEGSARRLALYQYSDPFTTAPRVTSDWPLQKRWLELDYPPETRWYSSLDFKDFSPWIWFNPFHWAGGFSLRHYAAHLGSNLAGVLTLQKTALPADSLWLALPQSQDESAVVRHMLNVFLNQDWNGRALTLEYPFQRAAEAFTANSFRLSRNLNWMRHFPAD